MNVQILEAATGAGPVRKRVAAYARVSREEERLAHSLAAQIEHYRDLICSNREWQYVRVYSDGARSGTTTEGRQGFQQLLQDCRAGKIDLVLCKSISRFARNTVDLLRTCRELKRMGIALCFEKEGINTLSGEGELLLSLLASFAQEESRSISENVKWGIRKGFAAGRSTHYRLYGYSCDGATYAIVPEEAQVVRRIFEAYLSGGTAEQLEKAFLAEGIRGPRGGAFRAGTIRRILTNVSYTGNAVLQREYIADHITHKRKRNTGELARYVVENARPAIISQSLFDAVQAARERRARSSCGSRIAGRITCAACGSPMRYVKQAGAPANGRLLCAREAEQGAAACDLQPIPEGAFRRAFAAVMDGAAFSEALFLGSVAGVTAEHGRRLRFKLLDGRVITTVWEGAGTHDEC